MKLRLRWVRRPPADLVMAFAVLLFAAAFLLSTVRLSHGQDLAVEGRRDLSQQVSLLNYKLNLADVRQVRLSDELDCRSLISRDLTAPQAATIVAVGRGLALLVARDDPALAPVVNESLGEDGDAALRKQLVIVLENADRVEQAAKDRLTSEVDCKAAATKNNPLPAAPKPG